jgi:hypothetical protein
MGCDCVPASSLEPLEKNMEGQAEGKPLTSRTDKVVMHVSDIHVGLRFDRDKWDELTRLAAAIKPDLVAVTGDVVNSPWWWALDRARIRLGELRAAAAAGRDGIELVCVPGNHDTRWQGIVPLAWFSVSAAIGGLISLIAVLEANGPLAVWHRLVTKTLWLSDYVFCLAALAALGLLAWRLCMRSNLRKALAPYYLTQPRLFADEHIGILPFDSASVGVSWARGFVPRSQMTAARKFVDLKITGAQTTARRPFVLALVHHHTLPLPYDHQNEPMMVMDNAGEFLRELAHSRVRLVLHGHKHHQHYARLVVDPASDARLEVAVLSAGTPTEGKGTLPNHHGFNVLTIRPDDQVNITRYESSGGPSFTQVASFDMVPPNEHRRIRFEARCETSLASCKRIVCVAEITRYGDGIFTREYRGVKTHLDHLPLLPTQFIARSDAGVVEPFGARSLSLDGPGVLIDNCRIALNEITARIRFKSSGLSSSYPRVDFQLNFLNNNAFALNGWQFSQMYPDREDFSEDVQFALNGDVAAEELVIHVHFPPDVPLPLRVDACSFPADDATAKRRLTGTEVVRIETQNALQLTLVHPEQGVMYQLSWDVDKPAADASPAAAAEALALRRTLAKIAGQPPLAEICDVLANALAEFEQVMEPEPGISLEGTLLAYEESNHQLVAVCDTQNTDPQHRYRFGLGIAGRAFKSGEALSFVLPSDADEICGSGYLRPDGTLPESLSDIPEQGIVCIPLYPDDAPGWPFAVLQVSWSVPSRALVRNIYQGHPAALQEAYARTLPILLRDILLTNRPVPKE